MRFLNVPIFVLCLFILNSCQKEFENPGDITADTTITFKAKIDRVTFSAVLTGATIRPDSVISIAGQSGSGEMLVFTVRDSGVHVYDLDMNSTSNFSSYTDARNFAYASNQGYQPGDAGGKLAIVVLDRINRLISGTFDLKVFREDDRTQKSITEGVFTNIRY